MGCRVTGSWERCGYMWGTCRGPAARNTTPPGGKRLVPRLVSGRGGRGDFSGVRAADLSRRKRVEPIQGILCVGKLAVVRVIPSGVVWPPTPCHPELEPATAILPIHAGV